MGALPKNKITRVERGKRRAGNKPNITKDPNKNAIPNHKKGFVAQLFRTFGLESGTTKKTSQPKTEKKSAKVTKSAVQTPAAKPERKAAPKTKANTPKVARITQHKG